MILNKLVKLFGGCLMILTAAGCNNKNEDVFEISSPDYNFKMVLKDDIPVSISENDTEYGEEDIAISKNIIEYEGKDSFFEGMYASVLMNKQAIVTLNGQDYKELRKEIYKDELSMTACKLESDDVSNLVELETSDGIIKNGKIVYEYQGDYSKFNENEAYIDNLKNDIVNSLNMDMNLVEINKDQITIDILDNKMVCTLDVTKDYLNDFNNDQITLIRNLTKNNYICK